MMHSNLSKRQNKEYSKLEEMQNKVVGVSMFVMIALFLSIVLLTRVVITISNNIQFDELSQIIINNTFTIPTENEDEKIISAETPYTTRFFVIVDDGKTISANVEHIAQINAGGAIELYKSLGITKNRTGSVQNYRYRYSVENDVITAVFIDKTSANDNQTMVTTILILLMFVSLLMIYLLVNLSSRFVIEPFVNASEAQKRFIADTSHDLKTPLAIIISNLDVVEMTSGKTEWTTKAKAEARNMSVLIDDMLNLIRTDSTEAHSAKEFVDISILLKNTISRFESVFKEKGIAIDTSEIAEYVIIKCERKQIEKVFLLLIQNASKYCSSGGTFKISMNKVKQKATITFYNDAEINDNFDCEKIFERFYRADSSRNSKIGGHGIGLSVVKKICNESNYNVFARIEEHGLSFVLELQ